MNHVRNPHENPYRISGTWRSLARPRRASGCRRQPQHAAKSVRPRLRAPCAPAPRKSRESPCSYGSRASAQPLAPSRRRPDLGWGCAAMGGRIFLDCERSRDTGRLQANDLPSSRSPGRRASAVALESSVDVAAVIVAPSGAAPRPSLPPKSPKSSTGSFGHGADARRPTVAR